MAACCFARALTTASTRIRNPTHQHRTETSRSQEPYRHSNLQTACSSRPTSLNFLANQRDALSGQIVRTVFDSLTFLRVHVRAQYRVHARQVTVTLILEPLKDVAVHAKMHGCLAARHYYAGPFPKFIANRRGLGRIGACLARAASDLPLDRAK